MNREIYKEASEWLVELRVGDVDSDARARLDTWFRASPEHVRAFLELSSIWEDGSDPDLDRAHTTEALIVRARAGATNVVPLAPAAPTTTARHRRLWPVTLAASLAIVALGGALASYYLNPTYSTGTGQQRTVDLSDGSKIQLNARSRIRVRFSNAQRDVELLEGQALFKVTKDAARPFVVRSDATSVRAVGTQFDVYRKTSGTTVTVVEGRVAVLPAPSTLDPQHAVAQVVSAGEQVTVTPAKVTPPSHADVAAATAWTQRELVFDGTPLSDVAQEFNRYNEKPLIVSDAGLKDFHVTGVFSSTNPASLLEFLRAQKDIEVNETDTAIRITKK